MDWGEDGDERSSAAEHEGMHLRRNRGVLGGKIRSKDTLKSENVMSDAVIEQRLRDGEALSRWI